MQEIAEVDYSDMQFVFIIDHYDVHQNGLCRYKGKLCYFETIDNYELEVNPLYYYWWTNTKTGLKHQIPFYRHQGNIYCKIYSMTFLEWAKHLNSRFWFEFCVGKHWTYPQRNTWDFSDWKPRWLRKVLYYVYYRSQGYKIGWPKRIVGDEIG